MEPIPQRKWYEKKRNLIGLGVIAVIAIAVIGQPSTPSSAPIEAPIITQTQSATVVQGIAPAVVPVVAPVKSNPQPTIPTAQDNTLSNDNTYTNSAGNEVHSPAYSNSIPQGASAKCRDGTYSFSQSRRGTCSHHGGVGEWSN